MKPIVTGGGILLAVVVLGLAGESPRSMAASPPAKFTDPAGDSGGLVPDVTSVTVLSPDSKQIVVAVAIGNQPVLATGSAVYLDLDTDGNSATGNSGHLGADYVLSIYDNSHFRAVKWNGKNYVDVRMPSLSVTYARGIATFRVDRSDLGDPTGFNFYVITQPNTQSDTSEFDLAPNRRTWSYQIAGATLALRTASAVASKPRAGAFWTARIKVVRSDTGKDLGPKGTVACAGTAGQTTVKSAFAGFETLTQNGSSRSFAVCKWRLPTTSSGKPATGKITVKYGSASTSRTFRAKVG
jgi:hypothetical protein